jgi:hypothetical protein
MKKKIASSYEMAPKTYECRTLVACADRHDQRSRESQIEWGHRMRGCEGGNDFCSLVVVRSIEKIYCMEQGAALMNENGNLYSCG